MHMTSWPGGCKVTDHLYLFCHSTVWHTNVSGTVVASQLGLKESCHWYAWENCSVLGHYTRQEKKIVLKGALHKKMTPAEEKCLNMETLNQWWGGREEFLLTFDLQWCQKWSVSAHFKRLANFKGKDVRCSVLDKHDKVEEILLIIIPAGHGWWQPSFTREIDWLVEVSVTKKANSLI